MTRLRTALVALTLTLAVPLGGCVSLFPKSDPVQLYRFDVEPAEAPAPASGRSFGVLKLPTTFIRAAATDRILTVSGGEAAFIAEARWVSPAAVLFDEAVNRTFQGDGGRVRLITRGEVAKADYALKLDVRAFETRYLNGPKAPPQVVVEVRAVLSNNTDRTLTGERVFTAKVNASDNRVGAIVAAYDAAVGTVLSELHAWANSEAR